ncbi:MAG: DUF1801 domain-containing protein [Flavobacteriales bacterium]|nr:DUF1801 domain-containing protein [Flavobacteriales bacterium]
MTSNLNHFYLHQGEPNRSCLLALRGLILKLDHRITETTKYGMPCFCIGKKMFCYLWVDKKTDEPYILIVEGNKIDHPSLEAGNRSRMKILRVNPNEDLPLSVINEVLDLALALYIN